MKIFRYNNIKTGRACGTTLPEMLVAVAITVAMLMISGTIFSSATTATGRASANTDIMHQHRTLTSQLADDLKGLRTDMPLVIFFEIQPFDVDGDGTFDIFPRVDRMVLFANGNYQNLYGYAGNAARIFYGQSGDYFLPLPDNFSAPPRRIFTRRWKMLMPDSPRPQDPFSWIGVRPTIYDAYTTENASLNTWKTAPFIEYQQFYFNEIRTASLIRRPMATQMVDTVQKLYSDIQTLYMLPDVTDFKIQFWYFDNSDPSLPKWRWYPDHDDFTIYNEVLDYYSGGSVDTGNFAIAWNIQDPAILPFAFQYINGLSEPPWICLPPGHILQDGLIPGPMTDPLPRALKFTYTLYDKNRSRFGEGQTFSYIIKLPQ